MLSSCHYDSRWHIRSTNVITPLKQWMTLMIHRSLAFLFTLQIWKFCIKNPADINMTTHNCLAVKMSSLHLPTEEVQLCELCVHYNKINFHNNIFGIYPNLPTLSCQHTADGDVPLDWVVCCYPFDDMVDSHCLVNGHQSLGWEDLECEGVENSHLHLLLHLEVPLWHHHRDPHHHQQTHPTDKIRTLHHWWVVIWSRVWTA